MDDLRELFEDQRRAESAHVPPFGATLARARQHQRRKVARRGLWLYGTVSAAAIVVLTVVTLNAWRGGAPAIAWSAPLGVELSEVTWDAPTDFLLQTPDAVALTSVPRLARLRELNRLRDLAPTRPRPDPDTND